MSHPTPDTGNRPTPAAGPADSGPTPQVRADAWAWAVCWLMFACTVLNYMDRQAISLVNKQIKGEFHLDNTGFGWVMAAFSLAYAVCQVPAGFLVDRYNVRRTYAVAVAWWSLAGIAAAFSPVLGLLLVFRALLGVGESFNWPCALRVTSRILPPSDRSLGNGIFNSGAAAGAVLTPLVVTVITEYFGWRTAFVAVGSLGFLWVVAWLAATGGRHSGRFEAPAPEPPRSEGGPAPGVSGRAATAFSLLGIAGLLTAATSWRVGLPAVWWGIALVMFGLPVVALLTPERDLVGADWARSLGEVARHRRFYVLVAVSVSINTCWHFLVSWLPTYLREDRAMTFLSSGLWSAMPFLAADVGNIVGGASSRLLANRGMGPVRGRLTVMTVCTLLITCGAWVGLIGVSRDGASSVPGLGLSWNDLAVIALLSLMALGTAAFMANYFAFTQEVSPRHTGLIVGYLGGLGNLCAAGFLPFAGLVKDQTGGFAPIFVLVGILPFFGLAALAVGWGRPEANAGSNPA